MDKGTMRIRSEEIKSEIDLIDGLQNIKEQKTKCSGGYNYEELIFNIDSCLCLPDDKKGFELVTIRISSHRKGTKTSRSFITGYARKESLISFIQDSVQTFSNILKACEESSTKKSLPKTLFDITIVHTYDINPQD